MLRNAFSFLAGAATVTAAVLATGSSARFIFTLGFMAALALVGILVYAVGYNRVARIAKTRAPRPSGSRQNAPQPISAPKPPSAPATSLSPVESEVVSALMNMGSRKPAAIVATRAAAAIAPQEFEPLFLAAVRQRQAA